MIYFDQQGKTHSSADRRWSIDNSLLSLSVSLSTSISFLFQLNENEKPIESRSILFIYLFSFCIRFFPCECHHFLTDLFAILTSSHGERTSEMYLLCMINSYILFQENEY